MYLEKLADTHKEDGLDSHPGCVLAQVASFILYAVGVLDLLEKLHLLNDVLPLLHMMERGRENQRGNLRKGYLTTTDNITLTS